MNKVLRFLAEHRQWSRRYFLNQGIAAFAAANALPIIGRAVFSNAELEKAIAALEPFFTSQEAFRDVSRGKPLPHSLPEQKKREVGLDRSTWKLNVISDSENPAKLGRELTIENGGALSFDDLLK